MIYSATESLIIEIIAKKYLNIVDRSEGCGNAEEKVKEKYENELRKYANICLKIASRIKYLDEIILENGTKDQISLYFSQEGHSGDEKKHTDKTEEVLNDCFCDSSSCSHFFDNKY